MAEKTRALKAEARSLGFDKVGIARADAADPQGRLRAWLDRGYDAGMDYLARTAAERADPREMMVNARSVVALAMSYYDPDSEPERDRGQGKIARYATSRDYHRVIRKKIRKLRKALLRLEPGAEVHPTVDTSPVLEREWARRAGITWTGKSTMAIAPDLGTYTFLATLVTSVELEYDAPHPDRCGSCTACLDACPTDAFVQPHVLDARRCITYWTVEHRDALPSDAPAFHGWVAGCDICQEVCPWNKFARARTEPKLVPNPDLVRPDLDRLAAADQAAWREELLGPTSLARTGEAAIRRNAERVLSELAQADQASKSED